MHQPFVLEEENCSELDEKLLCAVKDGNIAQTIELLRKGASINCPKTFLLGYAIRINDFEKSKKMVELLFSKGIKLTVESIKDFMINLDKLKQISELSEYKNQSKVKIDLNKEISGKLLPLLNAGANVNLELKNAIDGGLGENTIKWIKIEENNGQFVYRKADKDGNPVKNFQESKDAFKVIIEKREGSYLVGHSLFKTKPGLPQAMMAGNIAQYFTGKDGGSALCASKVEEDSIEKNSLKYLEEVVNEKALEQTRNSFSLNN